MKNILKSHNGISLLELMLVSAILILVLSLGFTLYFFGEKSFNTSTNRAHLQQNARLVDEYLKNELRNIETANLTTTGIDATSSDALRLENKILYKGSTSLTDEVISDIKIKIVENSGNHFLEYKISTADGEHTLLNGKLQIIY